MNDFKHKVFEEFEANCSHVLGVSSYRVREVLGHHGENIDDKFEAAWQFGGAAHMRQTMSMTIATLEAVYHESEIGKELTEEEQLSRFESWGIGLTPEIVDAWKDKRVAQFESEEKRHEPGTPLLFGDK